MQGQGPAAARSFHSGQRWRPLCIAEELPKERKAPVALPRPRGASSSSPALKSLRNKGEGRRTPRYTAYTQQSEERGREGGREARLLAKTPWPRLWSKQALPHWPQQDNESPQEQLQVKTCGTSPERRTSKDQLSCKQLLLVSRAAWNGYRRAACFGIEFLGINEQCRFGSGLLEKAPSTVFFSGVYRRYTAEPATSSLWHEKRQSKQSKLVRSVLSKLALCVEHDELHA